MASASPGSPAVSPAPTEYQVLDPAGRRRDDAAHAAVLAQVGTAQLCDFYEDMALTRRFDVEATALQRQGQLGLWVPSLGQEATQIGAARALRPQDFVFPGYRDHGVLRVRGVGFERLLPLFRGTDHGGWDPREFRCHLYTLVVGAQTLHATGYALGIQHDGLVGTGDENTDEAVAVFFGDGATSQGDVNESLVFAAAAGAPIVFLCVNNGWAISEPVTRQSKVPLVERGRGFGIDSLRVDGNDVLACYAAVRSALDAARAGDGPAFLELVTYRLGAHTTSDDPTRYRPASEEDAWRALDPLERLERHLRSQGIADEFFARVAAAGDGLGASVREACLSLPEGDLSTHLSRAYASANQTVAREQRALAEAQGVHR